MRYASPLVKFEIKRNEKLSFTFANVKVGTGGTKPYYEGEYTITPRVYEQTMATREKTMRSNVTIQVIPLAQVDNPQGGMTATIG